MSEAIEKKLKVLVSVVDEKAQLFYSPACTRNLAEAIRNFEDVAKDETSLIGKHSGDFALYHIGYFDEDQGSVVPLIPIVRIAAGSDFKEVR